MIFKSIRLAQKKAIILSGAHSKAKFLEMPSVFIMTSLQKLTIEKMSPPKELIEHWRAEWELQKGFKFKNKEGKEIKIIIEPANSGYVCWMNTGGEMFTTIN